MSSDESYLVRVSSPYLFYGYSMNVSTIITMMRSHVFYSHSFLNSKSCVTSSRSLVSPPLRRSKSCLLFVSPSAHSTFLCTLTLTLGSHVMRQLESNSVAAAFIPNSDFLRATYFQQQYVVRSSLP